MLVGRRMVGLCRGNGYWTFDCHLYANVAASRVMAAAVRWWDERASGGARSVSQLRLSNSAKFPPKRNRTNLCRPTKMWEIIDIVQLMSLVLRLRSRLWLGASLELALGITRLLVDLAMATVTI
jgi:hypothetical protein